MNENGFCKQHSGIEERLKNVETETKEQWAILEKLRNRPPVWTTVVIAILTGLLGYFCK